MNRLAKLAESRQGRPLLGISLHRFDLAFVEIVKLLGFDAVWIEMEHMAITFREATDLCRLAAALDLITLIRIPNADRESVLKTAECGPDIIDLPMANSPDMLQDLVRHARYAPAGDRGFFSSSRALKYGVYQDVESARQEANRNLCLMSQIETREAVDRADELCAVAGIDAIFLGLGDLSTSYGLSGRPDHPTVIAAADRAIAIAKKHGRKVAIAANASEAGQWARKGVDLVYCGSDTACLRSGAQDTYTQAMKSMSSALPERADRRIPARAAV